MGIIIADICSYEQVYQEIFWFEYVQYECIAQGIERMTMSCMHNSKTQKLFNMYERLGFTAQETKFVKQLC